VLKALRRLIETAGFDVTTYSTGAGFISDISVRPPDCVVLDLHMPDMNGFAGSARACQRRGTTAYLCKAVDVEALIGAIREALHSGKGAAIQELPRSPMAF
jgi:FixJ family two-component response regulator